MDGQSIGLGSVEDVARAIAERATIPHDTLRRLPFGENILFETGAYIIKIYAPDRDQHAREAAALELAERWTAVEAPRIVARGEVDGSHYIVMTRVEGTRLFELWPSLDRRAREPIVRQLSRAMRELQTFGPRPAALTRDWRAFIEHQAATSLDRQRRCGVPQLWLAALPRYLDERELVMSDESVFLNGDIHAGNILVAERNGAWTITGVVDFGDSFIGPHEYEFVTPGVLMVQGDAGLQIAMFEEYGYTRTEIDEQLRRRLMLLTIFYECSDLRKYALRLRADAINLSLEELERAIYPFAHTPNTRSSSSPR